MSVAAVSGGCATRIPKKDRRFGAVRRFAREVLRQIGNVRRSRFRCGSGRQRNLPHGGNWISPPGLYRRRRKIPGALRPRLGREIRPDLSGRHRVSRRRVLGIDVFFRSGSAPEIVGEAYVGTIRGCVEVVIGVSGGLANGGLETIVLPYTISRAVMRRRIR